MPLRLRPQMQPDTRTSIIPETIAHHQGQKSRQLWFLRDRNHGVLMMTLISWCNHGVSVALHGICNTNAIFVDSSIKKWCWQGWLHEPVSTEMLILERRGAGVQLLLKAHCPGGTVAAIGEPRSNGTICWNGGSLSKSLVLVPFSVQYCIPTGTTMPFANNTIRI